MVTIREFENRKEWYLNNKFHREDGPAREWIDGNKEWYLNGKLHCTDGPARELSNGTKEWYLNGKLHRTDGPAIVWWNGTKEWWLNGIFLSFKEIKLYQITRLRDLTIALLPLELPPYVIFWILEISECAYIAELVQRSVIKMIEGIRNSREKLKNISI